MVSGHAAKWAGGSPNIYLEIVHMADKTAAQTASLSVASG